MIDPATMIQIAQAAQGQIPAYAKMGLGVAQGIKARRLANRYERPTYAIPDAQNEALSEARALTNRGLVGGKLAAENIAGNASNTIKSIQETGQDSASKLAAITGVNSQQNDLMNNLALAEANFRLGATRDYMAALGVQAGYEDKVFKMNKYDPWNDAMNASAALNEASIKNTYGGLSDMAGSNAQVLGAISGVGGDNSNKSGVGSGAMLSGVNTGMRGRGNARSIEDTLSQIEAILNG